jgi:hypothetical protein
VCSSSFSPNFTFTQAVVDSPPSLFFQRNQNTSILDVNADRDRNTFLVCSSSFSPNFTFTQAVVDSPPSLFFQRNQNTSILSLQGR